MTEPNPAFRAKLRRAARVAALAVAAVFLCGLVGLYSCQGRWIYHPRRYSASDLKKVDGRVKRLEYHTGAGRQVAYYVTPEAGPTRRPKPLWVVFGGNMSLALEWTYLNFDAQNAYAGHLLIEYPGYGECEGRPTRAAIQGSAEAALAALARHLELAPETLLADLRVFGVSLGTANALELAVRHPAKRVVLVSPFTSMMELARLQVGWPLCRMLRDRYDSRARMAEIARRPDPPRVTIFHGDADAVVPAAMGRELAAPYPNWVEYHEIAGANHDNTNWTVHDQVRAIMAQREE